MFKSWSFSAEDGDAAARGLEAHLNEYADEVLSVAYAIADRHYVLAVYKPVEYITSTEAEAIAVAETIIDEAQT